MVPRQIWRCRIEQSRINILYKYIYYSNVQVYLCSLKSNVFKSIVYNNTLYRRFYNIPVVYYTRIIICSYITESIHVRSFRSLNVLVVPFGVMCVARLQVEVVFLQITGGLTSIWHVLTVTQSALVREVWFSCCIWHSWKGLSSLE